jgi:uncharacterized SAM-binding protein YcdF (DUF218 family)
MFVYLSKVLPLMVLPVGLTIELVLLGAFLAWRGRRKPALFVLLGASALLWVASMPLVGDALLGRLERAYPAVSLEQVPARRCIVLLGGAAQPALSPRMDIDLGESVDRVRIAAMVYQAGKGELIIASGGGLAWPWSDESEAGVMLSLLREWSVPRAAVIPEAGARNTHENALYAREILEILQCGPPLLVTSAAHMPRAVAVFNKQGIEVVPVTADVRVYHRPVLQLRDFLPDANALQRSSDALRERLGLLIYRLRGWA